jgi:hypothetical protein
MDVTPQCVEIAAELCDEALARGSCLINDWII